MRHLRVRRVRCWKSPHLEVTRSEASKGLGARKNDPLRFHRPVMDPTVKPWGAEVLYIISVT